MSTRCKGVLEHLICINDSNIQYYFDGETYQLLTNPVIDNSMAEQASICAPHPPTIKWVEHPTSSFRYRYDSEVGSHGSLMGEKNSKKKKSNIRIEVLNYIGKLRIRASLYTEDGQMRHVHKLQGKLCNEDGVYEQIVDVPKEGLIHEFSNVCILHVTKKNIPDILYQRFLEETRTNKRMLAAQGWGSEELTEEDEKNARAKADKVKDEIKTKLNKVIIRFEAEMYLPGNGTYVHMTDLYSKPISNQKAAATGELKICRLSHCSGSANGGDEVIILCERVDKKNIRVRFFDEEGDEPWIATANISDMEVHHQYAITFKTPPYKNVNIEETKMVKLHLYRSTDDAVSEAHDFEYRPHDDSILKHKRSKLIFSSASDGNNGGNEGGTSGRSLARRRAPRGLKVETNVSSSCEASCSEDPVLNTAEIIEQAGKMETDPEFMMTLNDPLLGQTSQIYPLFDEDFVRIFEDTPFELDGSGGLTGRNSDFDDIQSDSPHTDGILTSATPAPDNLSKSFETSKSTAMSADHKAEMIYRLAVITAKALQGYATTSSVKRLLVTMRHLISIPDANGDNSIHLSVIHSQTGALKELLEVLPEECDALNQYNNLMQTPLHIAVHSNDPEIIPLLLNFGSDPTLRDKVGNSPVHVAAQNGMDYILEKIMKNSKPNLDLLNCDGLTALHLAVSSTEGNALACVRLLCEANAKVDVQNLTSGRTALHIAVEKNLVKIAQLLIEKDANVDSQTFDGSTALHFAVANSSEELVRTLIAAQADPYIENNERFPPLEVSSDEEAKEILEEKPEVSLSEVDVDYDDDDDDIRGHNSFDLAKDNERLLDLLKGIAASKIKPEPLNHRTVYPLSSQAPIRTFDSGFEQLAKSSSGTHFNHSHTEDSGIIDQSDFDSYNVEMNAPSGSMPLVVGGQGSKPQRRQSDSGICLSTTEDENWGESIGGKKSFTPMDSGICLNKTEVELMDDEVKQMLADLLDPPGDKDWRSLCQCVGLDWLTSTLENMASPSKVLLSYVQTLNELEHGLEAMDSKEGHAIVVNYRKTKGLTRVSTQTSDITDRQSDFVGKMAKMNLR